jgi:hypothetical protein
VSLVGCTNCASEIKCTVCSASNFFALNNATNTCGCIPGYYLNGTQCVECTSPCLQCISQTKCTSCVNGFILFAAAYSCQAPVTQATNVNPVIQQAGQLSVVLNSNTPVTAADIQNIKGQIQETNGTTSRFNKRLLDTTETLVVDHVEYINANTVKVYFKTPSSSYNNAMINVAVANQIFSVGGGTVYNQDDYSSQLTGNTQIAQNVLISITIVIALAMYMLGHKHNHIMYYIQKMSFMRFALQN